MNEKMNERMNERINEWINGCGMKGMLFGDQL